MLIFRLQTWKFECVGVELLQIICNLDLCYTSFPEWRIDFYGKFRDALRIYYGGGGDEFIVSFGVNDTKIRGPSEAFYFFCPGRVDNRY